jgi:hypothetical protein
MGKKERSFEDKGVSRTKEFQDIECWGQKALRTSIAKDNEGCGHKREYKKRKEQIKGEEVKTVDDKEC